MAAPASLRWGSRGVAALLVGALVLVALGPIGGRRPPAAAGAVFSVVGEILAPRREPEPPPRREPAAPRPNEIAAPSQGASSEPPRIEVTAPIWLARPRHPERRYPGEAFAAGVEGAVELDCEVDLAGKLVCSVIWESPAGWGFGEAALVLAGEHVMAPLQHEGAAALGRYRMRIPFTQSPR